MYPCEGNHPPKLTCLPVDLPKAWQAGVPRMCTNAASSLTTNPYRIKILIFQFLITSPPPQYIEKNR